MKKKIVVLAALLVSSCVLAEPEQIKKQYQDWYVQIENGKAEAYTADDDSNLFGVVCGKPESYCLHYLQIKKISCVDGTEPPILISGASGAVSTHMHCSMQEPLKIQRLDESEAVERVMSDSEYFGISVPLRNGRFGNTVFSLKGSPEAISEVKKYAIPQSLIDQVKK